jgi:predicted O-linked N-acetylglucosamine transferase (SPINDLY family)
LRAAWANAAVAEHDELAAVIVHEMSRLAPDDLGFQMLRLIHGLRHGSEIDDRLSCLLAEPQKLEKFDTPVIAQLINALNSAGWQPQAHKLFEATLRQNGKVTDQVFEIQVNLALELKRFEQVLELTEGTQEPRLRYLRALACAQTLQWEQLAECQLTAAELHQLLQSAPDWRPDALYLLAHLPGYDDADLRLLAQRVVSCIPVGTRTSRAISRNSGHAARPRRLRIAYLSGDFKVHPVAELITPVLQAHDKARFELFALDNSRDDASAQRQHILSIFDHVIPIRGMSNRAVAQVLQTVGIDILVSLGGFLVDGREQLLAHSAVPLHMAWMGFPGSLGPPYVDYTITDAVSLPDEVRTVYAEAVVRLPVADRPGGELPPLRTAPSRHANGLPEGVLVLACFNQHNKISADTFDRWCTVLQAEPSSVLWLTEAGSVLRPTLLQAAASRGIAGERLLWAPRLPLAQHLERIACADLILDCQPFTMHATAVNAIAAGVPFLTYCGKNSLGRVSAGLLHTAGLGDCVCDSANDYVQRMVALVRNDTARAQLRKRFAAARDNSALFDCAAFASYLEEAYDKAYDRWLAGLPPADISPALRPINSAQRLSGKMP